MSSVTSLKGFLTLYKDKRLLVIFSLGMLSGFPWVLIGSAMTAWLQESGLSRSAIGFFGSVFVVYAFNFLWAPLVDNLKIPILSKLGRRRSWIILMQFIILLLVLLIAFTNPGHSLLWTSLLALGIAIASATQDVAIDAYRIEIIGESEPEKIPAGAAMATSGWWTGYSLPGAAALILSDQTGVGWQQVYLLLAGFVFAAIILVLSINEPQQLLKKVAGETTNIIRWFLNTIINPVSEFIQRNGFNLALAILSFIFLFKIGEAFLGRMSIVFYKEVGFSNTQIGVYSKIVGWWVIIPFTIIASMINIRYGIVKGLLISGIAMAATNLMFTWIALAGPNTNLFAAAVIVDNFTASFATVAFVSFISYLTNRQYTATQYALMASLGNLGRTTLASFSGVMVDALNGNWAVFFIITALMVVPSLVLLVLFLKPRIS